jgi:hypothetical protein
MNRVFFALPLLYAFAAQAQSGAGEQPVETAGPYAIAAFALLFLGAIAAFGWLTWRGSKKSKHADEA